MCFQRLKVNRKLKLFTFREQGNAREINQQLRWVQSRVNVTTTELFMSHEYTSLCHETDFNTVGQSFWHNYHLKANIYIYFFFCMLKYQSENILKTMLSKSTLRGDHSRISPRRRIVFRLLFVKQIKASYGSRRKAGRQLEQVNWTEIVYQQ